jgi:hypothetical protein
VLLQVRLADRPRILWADAICINQNNDAERGNQVALMGRIYTQARRTLICLGAGSHDDDDDDEDDSQADAVAGLVEDVSAMVLKRIQETDHSLDSFPWPAEDEPLMTDSRWTSLGELARQPWFGRTWVVQEAGLAREAVVLWRRAALSWPAIMITYRWLAYRGPAYLLKSSREVQRLGLHSWIYGAGHVSVVQTLHYAQPELLSPLEIIARGRYLGLSDPHDHVFAFLGITEKLSKPVVTIQPDYRHSVIKTYEDFILAYFRESKDMAFLQLVDHNSETLVETAAHPSWVPRLDAVTTRMTIGLGDEPKMCSLKKNTPEAEFRPDKSLLVRGVVVDTVLHSFSFDASSNAPSVKDIAELWKKMLTTCHEAQSDDPSPFQFAYSREMLYCAFIEVLTTGAYVGDYDAWSAECLAYCHLLQQHGADLGLPLLDRIEAEGQPNIDTVHNAVRGWTQGRSFIITKQGYIGLGPALAVAGDVCCVIFGTGSPFIPRKSETDDEFKVIGPACLASRISCPVCEGAWNSFRMVGNEGGDDWLETDERDLVLR